MTRSRSARSEIDLIPEGDPLPPEHRVSPPGRWSLETLYRSQAPRLWRFFSRRSCADEADDLTQEAFARFARRETIASEQVDEPEAYLTRVATNLLRDRAKFAVRRAAVSHLDARHIAVGHDPIQHLEERDALRRLATALDRLRPRSREVFLLHRREGMTYAEIAARTGLSVKAVKKQMAKALFELRRDIGSL